MTAALPKQILRNPRVLLVIVLFIGIFAMAVRAPSDSDLWWHLAAGDWMLEHGSVPRVDPFSHTVAGQHWIEQGWLPDLLTAWVFRQFGYAGLGLLMASLVTAALGFTYAASRAHTFARAFSVLLAAIASAVYWSMRPQLFSFLFFAFTLWILSRHRAGSRRIVWLIPPLMLLWANCHGAWISAYLLIGAYLAGETLERVFAPAANRPAWRPLLELAGAALLGLPFLALNPNGLAMLTYPFRTVGIEVLQEFIQEWASPDFHQTQAQPFLWLLLMTLAALALTRRRARFADLFALGGFTYLACMAGRNIALAACVAAPILAEAGQSAANGLWDDLTARWPRLHTIGRTAGGGEIALAMQATLHIVILLLVLAAAALKAIQPLSRSFNEGMQAEQFPAGAVTYLRAHDLPGKMFNSYNWGGYLIWQLYPNQSVFIDGRTDLYDDAFIRRYLRVTFAEAGWQDMLDEYGVGYLIIERDSFLSRYLADQAGWEFAYQDDLAVIIARQAG